MLPGDWHHRGAPARPRPGAASRRAAHPRGRTPRNTRRLVARKDNVITCRVADADLDAIDTLIEAGIRSTRSDAASWLIYAGIQAQAELFAKVNDTVAQIRRLRQEAQTLAQEHATDDPAPRPLAGEGT